MAFRALFSRKPGAATIYDMLETTSLLSSMYRHTHKTLDLRYMVICDICLSDIFTVKPVQTHTHTHFTIYGGGWRRRIYCSALQTHTYTETHDLRYAGQRRLYCPACKNSHIHDLRNMGKRCFYCQACTKHTHYTIPWHVKLNRPVNTG